MSDILGSGGVLGGQGGGSGGTIPDGSVTPAKMSDTPAKALASAGAPDDNTVPLYNGGFVSFVPTGYTGRAALETETGADLAALLPTPVSALASATPDPGSAPVYNADGTIAGWLPAGAAGAAILAANTDEEVQAALPPAPVELTYAISDETTPLTTGAAKLTVRAPFAFTLTTARGSLSATSTSGQVVCDINQNGSSILSPKLSIDQGEKTSTTAATAVSPTVTAIADDAELTFDIDQAGDGAAGLKITLYGTR